MVEDGRGSRDIPGPSSVCRWRIPRGKERREICRYRMRISNSRKWRLRKNVDEMAGRLSKPELEKAEKLVSEWSAQPTALTLKAKKGVGAAEELLKANRN